MSIANVVNTEMNKRNNIVTVNFVALSALVAGDKQYASGRYGAKIVADKNDSRVLIAIKNTHSAAISVNVAPGNSPYCAEKALAVSVPAASQVVVSLDSALYKDLSFGGYVLYTTDANYDKLSVACIMLP